MLYIKNLEITLLAADIFNMIVTLMYDNVFYFGGASL